MTFLTFIAPVEPNDELGAVGGVLDDARAIFIVSGTSDIGNWWITTGSKGK